MDHYVDIAVVGDYNFNYSSHLATNHAINDVEKILELDINFFWVDTKSIAEDPKTLSRYDGIWVAPGPYANANGVIQAIQYAREQNVPFLGTSAGCQFAILEFTKNVLNISEATSFFSTEGKGVISRKDVTTNNSLELEKIYLIDGSKSHEYYPQEITRECASKKLNITGELLDYFVNAGLKPSGIDDEGDVRIFEYAHNDFFVGTLFLPQLTSRGALPHPLITNFIKSSSLYREKQFLANEAMAV